nr:MAG TPA: hypothetical protein [Caudoviricetes sp.]
MPKIKNNAQNQVKYVLEENFADLLTFSGDSFIIQVRLKA